jgi:ABC-type xylose transport system substrate-binding protein
VDSAVINGSQDIAPGRQFKASAHKGLDPVVASGRLVVGYEADIQGFDPAKAQTAMEQALTKLNDKVDGVLVANDGMAGAVITALTARGTFMQLGGTPKRHGGLAYPWAPSASECLPSSGCSPG